MKKSVMLTDNEPIDPERNPVMTLEEALADRLAGAAVRAMRYLRRDRITRLQLIEYITSDNRRFSWTDEDDGNHMPRALQIEDPDPSYPDYLKKRKPTEVDYWPDGYPEDWGK